jgi:hypothetical protein
MRNGDGGSGKTGCLVGCLCFLDGAVGGVDSCCYVACIGEMTCLNKVGLPRGILVSRRRVCEVSYGDVAWVAEMSYPNKTVMLGDVLCVSEGGVEGAD